ncbi:MAG: hypothetical protein ACM3NH_03135 [Candidatus Saccharibacteria bacterium]
MLRFLKVIHTVIWVVMTVSNFLAFYFAFIGRFDAWFWVPAGLLGFEIVVILINWWKCPLTKIAEKYTQDRRPNFDIYLPEWLARYNVRIYSVLLVAETAIVLIRNLNK